MQYILIELMRKMSMFSNIQEFFFKLQIIPESYLPVCFSFLYVF